MKKDAEGVVGLLLDTGAEMSAKGGVYGNALRIAIQRGELELVQLLPDNGADANSDGGKYGSVLQLVIKKREIQVAQDLLANGANVNAREVSGSAL